MFKLREFKNKPSLVKSAIKKNNLHDIHWCYTKAGKSYNADEYERMMYDQIAPGMGGQRRKLLSMAGSSVVSKKERRLIDKESQMIEQYYRNYHPQGELFWA